MILILFLFLINPREIKFSNISQNLIYRNLEEKFPNYYAYKYNFYTNGIFSISFRLNKSETSRKFAESMIIDIYYKYVIFDGEKYIFQYSTPYFEEEETNFTPIAGDIIKVNISTFIIYVNDSNENIKGVKMGYLEEANEIDNLKNYNTIDYYFDINCNYSFLNLTLSKNIGKTEHITYNISDEEDDSITEELLVNILEISIVDSNINISSIPNFYINNYELYKVCILKDNKIICGLEKYFINKNKDNLLAINYKIDKCNNNFKIGEFYIYDENFNSSIKLKSQYLYHEIFNNDKEEKNEEKKEEEKEEEEKEEEENSKKNNKKKELIEGGIGGVVAGIIIIGFIIYCCKKNDDDKVVVEINK